MTMNRFDSRLAKVEQAVRRMDHDHPRRRIDPHADGRDQRNQHVAPRSIHDEIAAFERALDATHLADHATAFCSDLASDQIVAIEHAGRQNRETVGRYPQFGAGQRGSRVHVVDAVKPEGWVPPEKRLAEILLETA